MKSSAFLALSLILSACGGLQAQDNTPANAAPVTLGQSLVALNGWVPHPCDVQVFVAIVG
jgi:hypothetical protein